MQATPAHASAPQTTREITLRFTVPRGPQGRAAANALGRFVGVLQVGCGAELEAYEVDGEDLRSLVADLSSGQ